MKKIAGVVVLVSLLGLWGCATLFKGGSQKVDTTSAPVKAQVYVNGQLMGETLLQLKLAVKKEYAIEFRAEGYQPRVYHLNNRVGAGWIVLDVLAGLVPVIVTKPGNQGTVLDNLTFSPQGTIGIRSQCWRSLSMNV